LQKVTAKVVADEVNMAEDIFITPGEPLRLTLRYAALLHVLRYGGPPWVDDPRKTMVYGASQCGPDDWIMCCGHVYTDAEIAAMEKAGWIRTDGPRDHLGRRQTSAGPNICDAWKAPYYDPPDPDEPEDEE
jgi:hypothetical protein